MKRIWTWGCVLACLALSLNAAAQKLGVVDMKAIADRSERIQADLKKSQGQVQREQERLEAKMDEMQKLRQDLNARRSAMTDAEVQAQDDKLQALREEYDGMQRALNKQIDQIQRNVLRPQAERIQKIISSVARQQGLDLVVDAEAAIYHSESIDITPLVIQTFDREAATAPAAAATPAPKSELPKSDAAPAPKTDKKKPRD